MSMNTFNWDETSQLNWWQILLAFFIPSGIAVFLFHGILPILVENGMGRLSSWAILAIIGLGLFLIGGIFLVRREAQTMNLSFFQRVGFKNLTGKEWRLYIGLLIVALILIILSQQITLVFMDVLNFNPPDYYPFTLDPRIDPTQVPESQFSPNEAIQGNLILIPIMIVTLLVNIFAEEIYFRGYLQPKMVKLGHLGWILNGLLFALYHIFQLWLFPTLVIGALIFAFLFYKSRSLWVIFIAHFVGNFLLGVLGIIALVMS